MSPLMWLLLIALCLWLAAALDRAVRTRRQAAAVARRRWSEYADMAAHNAERWRTH